MKMVTVRIPAMTRYDLLQDRINASGVLLKKYRAYSDTEMGKCGIFHKNDWLLSPWDRAICSTEYPGGKRAKPNSYGELLVTLPAHVVRKGVKTEAV